MPTIVPPRVADVRPVSPRRVAAGAAAGTVLGISVTAGISSGLLAGPVTIVLLGLVLLAIPTTKRGSTRIAVNGGITLGLVPVLWWIPWSPSLPVGRAGLLLGVACAVLAALVVVSSPLRRRVFRPRLTWSDLWLPAAAGFAAWFFLPFFRVPPTLASVAMVMQSFGNDNVAHFDMFEMTRRFGVAGPGWPAPSNGSVYAYVPYPQSFHSFAAFISDLWGGYRVGGVGAEVRLFGISSAIAISFGFLVLVAALIAIPLLRRHAAVVALVVIACTSVFFLGPGALTLKYGFPNFFLGLVASVGALVLSVGSSRLSVARIAGAAGLIVFVAHSWILLVPLAAIGPILMVIRAPWRDRSRRTRLRAAVAVVTAAFAATAYAAFLVLIAVRSAGGPAQALATGGGVALNYPPVTLATAGLCVGAGAVLVAAARSRVGGARLRRAGYVVLGFGVVALLESIALIVVQLRQADALDYFQHKFLDGVQITATLVLVLALGLGAASVLERLRPVPATRRRSTAAVGGLAVIALAVSAVVFAGLPITPSPGLVQYKAHGLDFRRGLYLGALFPPESFQRQLRASTVMATRPCRTPVYLAGQRGDFEWAQANQWAMSFSSTWTESSAPVTTLLAYSKQPVGRPRDRTVAALLDGHPTRCVITAPQTRRALSAQTLLRYGDRVVTWRE